MSDDDLIRRGDAMKAMGDYHWHRYASRQEGGELSSPAVFTSHTWQDVQKAIAALPAVQPAPDVGALVEAAAQATREVFSGSCDHTKQAIDYMEQFALAQWEAGK